MTAVFAGATSTLLVVLVALRLVRPLPVGSARLDQPGSTETSTTERSQETSSGQTLADRFVHPAAVALAVVVAPLVSGISLVVPVGGFVARAVRLRAERRTEANNQRALVESLPEVVDLLSLAVGSGLVVRDAVGEVVGLGRDGLLDRSLARALAGADGALADRIENELTALGEPARPLAAVLVSGMRYGTPVIDPLDRLASDARVARRRRAETEARRLPVLMLLPLVLCGLPSFVLLAVVPVALSALDQLAL